MSAHQKTIKGVKRQVTRLGEDSLNAHVTKHLYLEYINPTNQ